MRLSQLPGRENLDVAIQTLLSFDTYARPQEVNKLSLEHIVPTPQGVNSWALVLFPEDEVARSKTQCADDTVMLGVGPRFRLMTNLAKALHKRALAPAKLPGNRLFVPNQKRSADILRKAVKAEVLEGLAITPHCFRHGGPSEDLLRKHLTRGSAKKGVRWKSDTSLDPYEKHGRLLKQLNRLSPAQLKRGEQAEAWLAANIGNRIAES